MIRRPFRLLAPVALVLALSACGFHLRDALKLPVGLGPLKVVSVDSRSPLADTLAQALTRAGAVPAEPRDSKATVLQLLAERWGDTPIAVDSFGRSQEYSLRYAVIFELRKGDGTVVVPKQTVELSRDYISIPDNSAGTEGEREILMRELRREMAASVLRRIEAVARRAGGVEGDNGETGSVIPDGPVAADAAKAALKALEAMEAEGNDVAPPAEPEPTPPPEPKTPR